MLKADHSLADLWSNNILGSDPSKAVLALDFDQTLTLVRPTGAGGAREKTLRGGTAARQALDEMAKAGVRMCIVTAQSPSAATVQNAANECRELGIDKLFGVEPVQLSLLEKPQQRFDRRATARRSSRSRSSSGFVFRRLALEERGGGAQSTDEYYGGEAR